MKQQRCNTIPVLIDVEYYQHVPAAQGLIGKDLTQINAAARWLAEALDIPLQEKREI